MPLSTRVALEPARIGGWSWTPGRAAGPPVEGPCLADEPADCDDCVGEVEERVDDVFVAFVAALQPVEGVVPGVCPLDGPALSGLDRGLFALMGDVPGHAAAGELVAGRLRVIAGVVGVRAGIRA